MSDEPQTCWDLVAGAANGDGDARRAFGELYLPIVETYIEQRWRGNGLLQDKDDAVQEVFVECFRDGGALEKVEQGKGSGFRGFLFGTTRNVAMRFERKAGSKLAENPAHTGFLDQIANDEDRLSRVFDREWARAIVRQAGDLQSRRAEARGGNALQRLEVLRRRFDDGMSVPDIAAELGESPELIHKWYARGRADFRECLRDVVSRHMREPIDPDGVEEECRRLLALLD